MPKMALVGFPHLDWLPPLPIPLFPFWPLAWLVSGVARLIERERPAHAETLRAAIDVFRELRGLTIDVQRKDERSIRVWFW